jgi:hypothetical protein
LTVDACVNTVPVAISKTASHVYPGNYDNVFRAVCDAAQAEAMTVSVADPGSGFVKMSSGANLATWGENLEVRLRPVIADARSIGGVADAVEVTVTSALKFGLVDWGKNSTNVERVFRRLSERLSAFSGPTGAWQPDPSGRHELRWWDGGRWTENVSDGGRPGVDSL